VPAAKKKRAVSPAPAAKKKRAASPALVAAKAGKRTAASATSGSARESAPGSSARPRASASFKAAPKAAGVLFVKGSSCGASSHAATDVAAALRLARTPSPPPAAAPAAAAVAPSVTSKTSGTAGDPGRPAAAALPNGAASPAQPTPRKGAAAEATLSAVISPRTSGAIIAAGRSRAVDVPPQSSANPPAAAARCRWLKLLRTRRPWQAGAWRFCRQGCCFAIAPSLPPLLVGGPLGRRAWSA